MSFTPTAAAAISSVFGRTGAVVATSGDYYGVVAAALTGVTAGNARFVGSLAVGAAPASGTFLQGDFTVNDDGSVWVCTVAGTQGTWVNAATILANASIPIAKLADPGAGKVIGSSGGAASAVNPPGFEIGYVQNTTAPSITDTSEATATALMSSGSLTFDGGPVIAQFFSPFTIMPTATGTTNSVFYSLFEGATQIGRIAVVQLQDLASAQTALIPVSGFLRFTPTAAAHTYKLTAFVNSVTGNPQMGSGPGGTSANLPAFLRFTKA